MSPITISHATGLMTVCQGKTKAPKKKKPGVKFVDADLNEDDDMEGVEESHSDNSGEGEEDDEEEMMNLLISWRFLTGREKSTPEVIRRIHPSLR
jgi:hypothetical protein